MILSATFSVLGVFVESRVHAVPKTLDPCSDRVHEWIFSCSRAGEHPPRGALVLAVQSIPPRHTNVRHLHMSSRLISPSVPIEIVVDEQMCACHC